jgi:hypothetical protein
MSAVTRRIAAACIAAIAVIAAPRLAAACAVCLGGVGSGGTAHAFAMGSLFLSVVPLAAFGGLVFYLRRRAKQIERETRERRETREAAATRAAATPLRSTASR